MAKFYGPVGYALHEEAAPGYWAEVVKEYMYSGDVLKNTSRFQTGEGVNDDLNISNKISILADPFARENFHHMRYIGFMGTKWKITNVEVQFPRLILTIGGVYNGPEPSPEVPEDP